MKLLFFLLITIAFPTIGNCQLISKNDSYKRVIKDFYARILTPKVITLKDYYTFFGKYAEDETALFFLKCDKGKQTEICSKTFTEHLASQSSHESLVFSEMRKLRRFLLNEDTEDINNALDKMNLQDNGLPDGVDVYLSFINGLKVIFVLNSVIGEGSSILDIYLTDGSSIFNKMGTRPQLGFYKRLGRINDSDGYVNVREGKGVNYVVKSKVNTEEIFFIYPNYKEAWWMIEKLNCERGYASKSKIILLGELPVKERNSLRDTLTNIYLRPSNCR